LKAAVLKNDMAMVFENVPSPEPGEEQVLVRVNWSSICGTDLHIYLGEFKDRVTYPRILGHEFSGVVKSVGKGVASVEPGDRVTVDPIVWCNQCAACLNGQNNVCHHLKLLGVDYDGGFADYVVAGADKVYKVLDSVSMRDAALIELYSLGVHSARKAMIEPGDRVVILGAGRLGLAVLEVIKQTAAAWVCAVDVIDNRLNIAEKMGADLTINSTTEDPVEKILSQTGGFGVDRVIECVGTYVEISGQAGPVQQAVKITRSGGRVVVMGLGSQLTPVFWKECVFKELQIVGSRVTLGDYPRALGLMELKKFHPDLLISEVVAINELNKAFHLLEEKPDQYLKILVKNQ
jgi:threonine dehydrogenase-like Zn-dependent dehydrogenase